VSDYICKCIILISKRQVICGLLSLSSCLKYKHSQRHSHSASMVKNYQSDHSLVEWSCKLKYSLFDHSYRKISNYWTPLMRNGSRETFETLIGVYKKVWLFAHSLAYTSFKTSGCFVCKFHNLFIKKRKTFVSMWFLDYSAITEVNTGIYIVKQTFTNENIVCIHIVTKKWFRVLAMPCVGGWYTFIVKESLLLLYVSRSINKYFNAWPVIIIV
jgi:hypothetical protein